MPTVRAPLLEDEFELLHGVVDVGQADHGHGVEAVLAGESPLLVDPEVERVEQRGGCIGVRA